MNKFNYETKGIDINIDDMLRLKKLLEEQGLDEDGNPLPDNKGKTKSTGKMFTIDPSIGPPM